LEKPLLTRLYEFLTRNDSVEAADLIFVLAGRVERKQYGLELYRAKVAPRLLLSVGRFEVSRMHRLEVEEVDGWKGLIALRDRTPAEERNFFVHFDAAGVLSERADLPRASTYGEAFALRKSLGATNIRKVLVISTDVHLRRTGFVFDKFFQNRSIKFRYCPVPSRLSFMTKEDWWRQAYNRFVAMEFAKLVGYRLILSLPCWISRRLMALKF
jgi:uncharacterized SAM-binding protein YcdF (DUF218 family)